MSHANELLRKGQLVELTDRRAELVKRFERARGDLVQYAFPSDPLNPIESCQVELVEQAVKDLVQIRAEFQAVQKAIRELGG